MDTIFNEVCLLATAAFALTLVPGFSRPERSFHLIHREWFGLARGYAYRCRRTIAIAAIMPKGIRMKSAMRMPIAKPFASGERPGGTATNRVSQSSSFMVPSELPIQYTDIAAVTDSIIRVVSTNGLRAHGPSCDPAALMKSRHQHLAGFHKSGNPRTSTGVGSFL
jgi:hypothetical protein